MLGFILQSYERRSRAIKVSSEKEMKYWGQFTPDMMSDEEKVGDQYICHLPSYRSDKLHKFIQRLDNWLEGTRSSHARHTRVLGSPVEKQPPPRAKGWMLKTAVEPTPVNDQQSQNADNAADEESFELSETD